METRIISCSLFKKFPELVFGFSTRTGGVSPGPYGLNLSISVGDDLENVKLNREIFFKQLGIKQEEITFQKQIHSSFISYSEKPQHFDGCDAIYTDKKNNFLAVSVADCIPVFLYDPQKKIIGAIHSGWKGTHSKILSFTIKELIKKFDVDVSKLVAFIGPGISQEHYEVGADVGKLFSEDVLYERNRKYFLDLKKDNYLQLLKEGVKTENIEISDLCTFREKDLLHSFRRDKDMSGRMMGVIGMR